MLQHGSSCCNSMTSILLWLIHAACIPSTLDRSLAWDPPGLSFFIIFHLWGEKEGKGKYKNQNPSTKKDVVCWRCGEKGHFSTACCQSPGTSSFPEEGQPKGGTGKAKLGTGTEASSLAQGDRAAAAERQPSIASSLDLASCEKSGASPEGWLKWRYHTGAAISAFPLDSKMCIGTETNVANYKNCFRRNHPGPWWLVWARMD